MAEVDTNKLNSLVGKMLGDLGGAFSVPTVRIGFRLGLFDALHREGPRPPRNLRREPAAPSATCASGRWPRQRTATWTTTPRRTVSALSPEQAMVFTVKDSPVYLQGAFDLVAAMIEGEPKVERAFREGGGVGWGDIAGCLFCATGAFFRPGYVNNIVQSWLPAIAGAVPRLEAGARVADVGCGVGFSTLLMAEAFPNSSFVGYDFHAPSIEAANAHAKTHGLGERVRFETAPAKEIAERDFDLVTMFDCLHDMGDPRGCAAHMRELLKPDGAWMIVEPIAADDAGRQRRKSGQPALLQRLDDDLRADLARPGGRRGPRRAGGREEADRGAHRRRFHAGAPRHRGSVQHGARGAAVGRAGPAEIQS